MTITSPKDLLQAETELLKSGLAIEEQGLRLLFAEMQALTTLIPGQATPLPTEAEIEEGFDNMPV
jgi:hypothetical protein